MPDVCPNLPDDLDRLDQTIAAALRSVGRASALPMPVRARLVAILRKMEWQTADCRRALHELALAPKDSHA